MSIFEWAVLGALLLGIVMFCARVMRGGIKTFDDHRRGYLENMRAGERRLEEDKKNISASEHVDIAYACVRDLLRLNDAPDTWQISRDARAITLTTPEGAWTLKLLMKESKLKSADKVLRGKNKWSLSNGKTTEFFADPADLFRFLNSRLRSEEATPPEPEHFARRVAGSRATRRARKEPGSPRV